ncbi:MAG: hypothetical protein NTX05_02345 [Fusobacteria bacterium]|nr:hypothetical protein [Fusobacteriota bacterium]
MLLPCIAVVESKFSTDKIVRCYIANNSIFQYKNKVVVVASFSDRTDPRLSYTSGAIQVILDQ